MVGDAASCTDLNKGSIRYNNTTNALEFCNGLSWNLLQAFSQVLMLLSHVARLFPMAPSGTLALRIPPIWFGVCVDKKIPLNRYSPPQSLRTPQAIQGTIRIAVGLLIMLSESKPRTEAVLPSLESSTM